VCDVSGTHSPQILLDEAESETRLLTVVDEAAILRALATGSAARAAPSSFICAKSPG
jgi:hypothetical protein